MSKGWKVTMGMCGVLIAWGVISYLNVLTSTMGGGIAADWNIFKILVGLA